MAEFLSEHAPLIFFILGFAMLAIACALDQWSPMSGVPYLVATILLGVIATIVICAAIVHMDIGLP